MGFDCWVGAGALEKKPSREDCLVAEVPALLGMVERGNSEGSRKAVQLMVVIKRKSERCRWGKVRQWRAWLGRVYGKLSKRSVDGDDDDLKPDKDAETMLKGEC